MRRAAPIPAALDVLRADPPAIRPCRWPGCGAWVEWVETRQGGVLPLTHPVTVLEGADGRLVRVAAAQCHLAHCGYAPAWLRQLWGGPGASQRHDRLAGRG